MCRLLVLYTGGTIGMAATPQGLAPLPGLLSKPLQRLAPADVEMTVLEYPQLIDSAAITPAHWNRMIDDIRAHYAAYDGFVIIHGTDTLAYSASVLAFALSGLGKPVVLTGAQLPLGHPRSDGWSNLADALTVAQQADLHEVVIAFNRQVLRGCRARKLDAASFAGFATPNAPRLAEFGIAEQWQRQHWRQAAEPFRPQRLDESVNIGCFFLTPGAGARCIGQALQAGDLHGAVLMSYGNGNAPADPVLLEGVRSLSAAGGAVLNISQVLHGAVQVGAYAASQPLATAGAVSGGDMTPEAALAKLHVLLSSGLRGEALRAALSTPIAGELTA